MNKQTHSPRQRLRLKYKTEPFSNGCVMLRGTYALDERKGTFEAAWNGVELTHAKFNGRKAVRLEAALLAKITIEFHVWAKLGLARFKTNELTDDELISAVVEAAQREVRRRGTAKVHAMAALRDLRLALLDRMEDIF